MDTLPDLKPDCIVLDEPDGPSGAHQTKYRFANGYGASVIRGGMAAYGGYELAVLKWDGERSSLTYETPITSDVEGHLTDETCAALLAAIEALPEGNE